jgi:predicted nucleic acid-binding protein
MDANKKRIAARIVESENIGLSAQVMQEFYTVAIRKADFRLSPDQGLAWLEKLEAFPCAPTTPSLVKTAVLHSIRYRISYWDGTIVAAAEVLGAKTLYTEDLNHGQTYGAVKVINPFFDPKLATAFHESPLVPLAMDRR